MPLSFSVEEAAVLKGHDGAVMNVKFNPDGRYCLTCGKDRTIKLWNPYKGLLIKTYLGHGRDVRDVAVTSDNARLVSCGGDRGVFLWDVANGRTIRRFRGHDSDVNAVRLSSLDTVAISAGYDRSIRVWDCRSHSVDAIQIMEEFGDSVTSVAMTGNEIVGGSVDGSVRTFDIRMGRVSVDSLGVSVNSVSVSRDGNCILAGCMDSTLRLLDKESGELLNEYRGHQNKEFKLSSSFSSDDSMVLACSEDGRVVAWDLVDPDTVAADWKAHERVVTGLSFHPNEQSVLTCSTDGTAKLFNVKSVH